MGDDWIGWVLAMAFFAFVAWLVARGVGTERRRLARGGQHPEAHSRALPRFRGAGLRFDQSTTPSVNMDGTPMSSLGGVDVMGKPLGITSP